MEVNPPRLRSSLKPWSLEGEGFRDFDGHECGPYSGGFTGDLESIEHGGEEVARCLSLEVGS